MAKLYLIGGAPRVGKTTLSRLFIKEQPTFAVSTDAIRHMLRSVLKEEQVPDLFRLAKPFDHNEKREHQENNFNAKIAIQNRESAIVWKSTIDFINGNLEDGVDILVEGIAVLPQFVKDLNYDCKVIFLGNQSKGHLKTMVREARNNPNDWMHTLSDETIESYSLFNKSYSRLIEEEAGKYKLPYFEIRDEHYHSDLLNALRALIS